MINLIVCLLSGSLLLSGPEGKPLVDGIKVIKTALPAGIGNHDERLVGFSVEPVTPGVSVTSIRLNLAGTENLDDIDSIRIYYNGSVERLNVKQANCFGSAGVKDGDILVSGSVSLEEGSNYFWVTGSIDPGAQEGHQVGANIISFTTGDQTVVPVGEREGTRTLLLGSSLLFAGGDGGSKHYRIPAIVTASDGSLVTATDKRWDTSADLPSHIDVVVRRSTDKGVTWSEPLTIAGTGTTTGYGDPALVVDRINGEIICLCASGPGYVSSTAVNSQRICQIRSRDNGITWSDPEDITPQIYGAGSTDPVTRTWRSAFVASGVATQLKSGRLMAVVAVRETDASTLSNFVIYSDDHGHNWLASTHLACAAGDEAKVVELENGQVLMSIRHKGTRLFNLSADQGITWGIPFWQEQITDPFCDGDLIRYSSVSTGSDRNRLLHSIPFANSRKNVSVLLSYNEGKTWDVRKTIYSGPSAYSSLCVLKDGTIGIYYEVGEYQVYEMYFVRFSLNWLTSGQDTR